MSVWHRMKTSRNLISPSRMCESGEPQEILCFVEDKGVESAAGG